MSIFYEKIIELIDTNDDLRILIKTKKKDIFEKLSIKKKIKSEIYSSGKIFIIDNNDFELRQIKKYIDLTVSISFYTPTIFMHSIGCGIRSVCYDYSGILNSEFKFLSKQKKFHNIYSNLDNLITDLKKDLTTRKDILGRWSKIIVNKIVYKTNKNGFEKIFKIIDSQLERLKY